MRKTILAVACVAALGACKKTGDGGVEVKTPTVGVQTDTVRPPSVEVGTKIDTVMTPTVEMKAREVKVPTVDVKRP